MKRNYRFSAYEEIKNRIIFLELKPGEKVFESDIAAALGVSRTPVREALLMLEKEGLVMCDDRLGFVVRKLSLREVDEYLALREALELFAAPLVIESITESEVEAIKRNLGEAERQIKQKDYRNMIRCETQFHEIFYKATKSSIFFATISGLVDKFQWLRAISLRTPGGDSDSLAGHKRIFEAIGRRDLKALKNLIHSHIKDARQRAMEQGVFFLDA